MSAVDSPSPFPSGRSDRVQMGLMGAAILLLHALGVLLTISVVGPHPYTVGKRVFNLGLALTAYTLGMRHAFDADHISAVDNTTRKLLAEGKRPLSVGFFFSLGHSTIVFLLSAALAVGVRAAAHLTHGVVRSDLGVLGTLISAGFLYLIALLNLGIFVGILGAARRMRQSRAPEDLEALLQSRGLYARLFPRLTRTLTRPWQMYPVGVLFGLGFDTASEVALLVLAGGAAASSLPWYGVLSLPILFAAGMSLLDTLDGWFMNLAYGWALSHPLRKIYYNIVVTGLSVAVAWLIGSMELAGVLVSELNLTKGFLAWVAGLDVNQAGFAIVGLFAVTWLGAWAVWHLGHLEERWSPRADG